MTLHSIFNLGLVFGWETYGIWTCVLHRSCICICKLDFRLLNHLNRTSTAQVMVHFPGLPQLRLFICCVQILGMVVGLIPELSSELYYGLDIGLFVAYAWLVLWPDHGLVVDSLGTESGTVLYPIFGMIVVWPIMACCVDYFLGISYATIGLEDQVIIP